MNAWKRWTALGMVALSSIFSFGSKCDVDIDDDGIFVDVDEDDDDLGDFFDDLFD